MAGSKIEREAEREDGQRRRWGGYALGMVIESAAVGAISLAALGLMYLIKVLVK